MSLVAEKEFGQVFITHVQKKAWKTYSARVILILKYTNLFIKNIFNIFIKNLFKESYFYIFVNILFLT